MTTVRDWLKRRFPQAFGHPDPPIIETEFGPTTEWARHQAAINMKADATIRAKVEALLIRQCGSVEAGMAEARRRFPEAYSDER